MVLQVKTKGCSVQNHNKLDLKKPKWVILVWRRDEILRYNSKWDILIFTQGSVINLPTIESLGTHFKIASSGLIQSEIDSLVATCGKMLLVIDFTVSWCGPCQFISPKFEAMSAQYPGVKFIKVDVDENVDVAQEFGIQSMPTFVFMKDGQKLAQFSGAIEEKLRSQVELYK